MARLLDRLRAAERSGSLYASGALASAATAATFYWLSDREQRARERLAEELDLRHSEAKGAYAKKLDEDDGPTDGPALWRGTIAQAAPQMLMGELMLRGTRVGEAVEVIAEDVGPGKTYLRCRNPKTGATGLYPMSWVEHPEKGRPTARSC